MSTLQQNPTNSFSPILLSPSSTTITNHIALFDNSDQGSVDSDYTSLGSSKFYGNSGSTSSLHRQGRSQSIDELASTTTIPTRHFNGTSNANKSNTDPLQFVKIHPNHELLERAQEQLSLAESRKRLQENYTLNKSSSSGNKINEEEIDWSKAVDDWRQKREQKRLKHVNSNPINNEQPLSPLRSEPIRKPEVPKKIITEPIPIVPSLQIEKPKPKSPSPIRIKGPAKIREIFIEKPVEIRGFGFKLEGGRTQNRPIYISTIEEGSPADKAGLYIDDEVVSINDETIEHMTFDYVRKLLKERNLRGSIKMVVRTYDDLIDDNSQTVTNGFTTDHSRTPSPQKPKISPSVPIPTMVSSSSTTNTQLPVYTFLPYTPPSSDPIKTNSVPTSSLNVFGPKPFRLTPSNPVDQQNNQDSTTTTTNEKQFKAPPPPPPPRPLQTMVELAPLPPVESLLHGNSNTDSYSKEQRDESPIAQVRSYVEKQMDQLQQDLEFGFSRTAKAPPSLAPAREQQQQRPVNIPVDVINTTMTSAPPQDVLRSSLKKSLSSQHELDQIPSNRTYGLKINPNENVIHYLDPYPQQKPTQNYTKRSIPDLPSMAILDQPRTIHSLERTVNELRIDMPTSYPSQSHVINQQQKKVTIQVGEKIPPQRISSKQLHASLNQAPRRTHFEDQAWIIHDQRTKSNGRRSAPLPPQQQQEFQMNRSDYHEHSATKQHRTRSPGRSKNNERILSVSGKLRCSRCEEELGHGSAMVIESLGLYYHIECFRCFVCNIPLSSSNEGIDVRVRNNRLHCQNCFSDENGVKLSAV